MIPVRYGQNVSVRYVPVPVRSRSWQIKTKLIRSENLNVLCTYQYYLYPILIFFKLPVPLISNSTLAIFSQEDFYQIYDAVLYRWRLNRKMEPYYESCKPALATLIRPLRTIVTCRPFDYAIYLIISANGLLLGKEDRNKVSFLKIWSYFVTRFLKKIPVPSPLP
jgi:hypothetical protein